MDVLGDEDDIKDNYDDEDDKSTSNIEAINKIL